MVIGSYYISEKDTEVASQHSIYIARTTTARERFFWIELNSKTRGIYVKKLNNHGTSSISSKDLVCLSSEGKNCIHIRQARKEDERNLSSQMSDHQSVDRNSNSIHRIQRLEQVRE
jgi:hypothetical protein